MGGGRDSKVGVVSSGSGSHQAAASGSGRGGQLAVAVAGRAAPDSGSDAYVYTNGRRERPPRVLFALCDLFVLAI